MDKTSLTRRLFQLLTFFIFLIQVYNSILKYIDGIIIQKQATISIDEIIQPDIFICLDGHYNYTKSLAYGYEYKTSFLTGNLKNSDKTSWKGIHQNLTFEDILRHVYNQEFGNFTVKNSTYKKIFSPNLGYCMHLKNTSIADITTDRKSLAVIVDPYKVNEMVIYEMEDARVTFGPLANNMFDYLSFETRISLYDKRIRDGISCTDYEKRNSSYGQCIKDVMRKRLYTCFDCIPLWFPGNSEEGCEVDKDVTVQDQILYKEIFQDIWELTSSRELESLNICLPPCMSMAVNLRITG